ncbi:PLP-dependent aminotransferase family protein [Pseudomonas sp. GX19020]|uniref:MocR-like pyridoxine biosynthesis transcription factor PdxR n=1 Tax=Pseudomonadota TaxID=1224 RepID=UPI0008955489|nr:MULTISPECIES: PLP-dependent aminotransferase family protein [Pseudomonadota]MCL4067325.1 PLP-dependent aminotransferase family protein [Pseudomonas sp. GX19020]SEC05370.1 transcriptional regulator, GntR family [Rhodobacter sp. 24-YEA-8]
MAIPVEAFFLASGAAGTLQSRIRAMVTEGILSGRFRPGQKMPSSRGLAAHLGISRITVTLAYGDLVSSDYLTSRGRSGYYVSDNAPRAPDFPSPARPAEEVDYHAFSGGRFTRAMQGVERPDDWERYPWPFIYGQTDPTLFDHQNWRACALRALGRRDFSTLTSDFYERDDPALIEQVLRVILPRRGIAAGQDEVLLTMGAQNALWIATEILLGEPARGHRAVIENPCYQGIRRVLEVSGAEVVSLDVDEGGLPLSGFAPGGQVRRGDVVYVTPSHQAPTNATMALERRLKLLEAASREDFIIIEDDYEFEMSFLKPVSPALKSLDKAGRVIYAGSFSKSIFPGMRLGYLVAPPGFIAEARALRAMALKHPPGHIQRTVAYFLAEGHYDALINRMRAAFRRRRQGMEEAIQAEGLTIAGQGGYGGSSFWMRAGAGVDTARVAQDLRKEGVLIEPGQSFFDPERVARNYYRLAYSSIQPARIPEGIQKIARAMASVS